MTMTKTYTKTKTAFITGYTGQDGTFLTSLLLAEGYKVIGLVRRISTEPPRRTRGRFDFTDALLSGQLVLEEGDLLSPSALNRIIEQHLPDEVYNLAAQSHVGLSFMQPEYTIDTVLDGTVNLIAALEANYISYRARGTTWRMYQASTSEMFGDVANARNSDGQDLAFSELSNFNPNSPYAIAKAAAHFYCRMKRIEGKFISCGILFNHESEIRGGNFVTQKIAHAVIKWQETGEPMELGNLDAVRDWGYAGDYVKAMWLMLQQDRPDDYVVATGEAHTVRDFVAQAFATIGYNIRWDRPGDPLQEVGRTAAGKEIVRINPKFYRPADVGYLRGDASKIRALGWVPDVNFEDLVRLMVQGAQRNDKAHS